MIRVILPDDSELELADGATAADAAAQIGPGLARAAVACKLEVDGTGEMQIMDLHTPLSDGQRLALITAKEDDEDYLYVLRHSTAHVMAEAICKLFPQTSLVYGPPVENGFYYDIDLDRPITPDDFDAIEAEMKRIIKENRPFTRYDLPRGEAMKKLEAEGSRYKIDNALRAKGDTLSFYVTGSGRDEGFEDLCRGPHLPSTGKIKAFKVMQVAGAYYRGDANEKQLQRVYGTAWTNKKQLVDHLHRIEEAKKRDHRVLGRELELFTISPEVGSGLVLWMPKGALVRSLLENFVKAELIKLGYDPVYTPHIGSLELYRTSGHFPYYKESQFPPLFESDRARLLNALWETALASKSSEVSSAERDILNELGDRIEESWRKNFEAFSGTLDERLQLIREQLTGEDGYLLRPMNCPHHIMIYKALPRSYRDLPVRLAEFGTVYRYEQSGELSGLTRVRGFTQDDAHVFCTPEQLGTELEATVRLTELVLSSLDLNDYRVRIGLRDKDSDKYVGEPSDWDVAEDNLLHVARELGLNYVEEQGEAAFYGPKIDFLVKDCIGREFQLGTVQVDYNLPKRFDLTYIGADNQPHQPVMIHRAPFGSMERFVGILIEHFAGAFPLWLAPVQIAVMTISEKSAQYGRDVYQVLHQAGLRVILDDSSDKIGPKKHRARRQRIPYILVVGEQEAAEKTVNVNDRDGRMLGTFPIDNFVAGCYDEIQTKGQKKPETSA